MSSEIVDYLKEKVDKLEKALAESQAENLRAEQFKYKLVGSCDVYETMLQEYKEKYTEAKSDKHHYLGVVEEKSIQIDRLSEKIADQAYRIEQLVKDLAVAQSRVALFLRQLNVTKDDYFGE